MPTAQGVVHTSPRNPADSGCDVVTLESCSSGRLSEGDTMASPEASLLGTRLDADHPPETNGRMAICRRCGFATGGDASDLHAPVEVQGAKANRWLGAQAHARRVARARGLLDT
jgi:hypothetical protein